MDRSPLSDEGLSKEVNLNLKFNLPYFNFKIACIKST